MDRYPATWSDPNGTVSTSISNDGAELRMSVRGVEFAGRDFESFSPVEGTPPDRLAGFSIHHGCLCSYRLKWRMPIPVRIDARTVVGGLWVGLVVGDPGPNGSLVGGHLQIALDYGGFWFQGSGTSGWFESELLEIREQLPAGTHLLACIDCLYSDYSPYGSGMFGSMMCFRNLKEEYLRVSTKDELFEIHDRYDRTVQETYLCPEFEKREPGTGYRG